MVPAKEEGEEENVFSSHRVFAINETENSTAGAACQSRDACSKFYSMSWRAPWPCKAKYEYSFIHRKNKIFTTNYLNI